MDKLHGVFVKGLGTRRSFGNPNNSWEKIVQTKFKSYTLDPPGVRNLFRIANHHGAAYIVRNLEMPHQK